METKSLYAAMLAVMGLFVAFSVGTLSALARLELPGAEVVILPATDDALEAPDPAAVYGPMLPVEIELPAPAGGRATPLPPARAESLSRSSRANRSLRSRRAHASPGPLPQKQAALLRAPGRRGDTR